MATQVAGTSVRASVVVEASEVEVTFVADGPRTNVMLEHRNLDRHGEGWEANRDALGSPDGWPMELNAFAKAAVA